MIVIDYSFQCCTLYCVFSTFAGKKSLNPPTNCIRLTHLLIFPFLWFANLFYSELYEILEDFDTVRNFIDQDYSGAQYTVSDYLSLRVKVSIYFNSSAILLHVLKVTLKIAFYVIISSQTCPFKKMHLRRNSM